MKGRRKKISRSFMRTDLSLIRSTQVDKSNVNKFMRRLSQSTQQWVLESKLTSRRVSRSLCQALLLGLPRVLTDTQIRLCHVIVRQGRPLISQWEALLVLLARKVPEDTCHFSFACMHKIISHKLQR